METGLFVIRKGVAQPLALNICLWEANGGIPVSYFSDSIWNQKERSFGSGRAGIWAWFSTFSASAIITGPAIRLQTFVSLSASVRMSAGFVLFRFF